MNQERLEASLEGIRHLLSHLHGEVTALEESYSQVLLVLKKLEGAANVDELTGLLRRRSFFQKWESLLDECQRLNESSGLLLIDIDHFKRINDTHGHPAGDEVIKRVAALLKQYESPSCIVGRYGGEEFTIAIQGTEKEVLGMAEFIRRGVERLMVKTSDGTEIQCTLSVGMASAQKVAFDATRLLEAADQALYAAKRKGRNQVQAA